MRRRWMILALTAAAGALAVRMAGCASGSTTPPGGLCNSDSMCESGTCVGGRCVAQECDDVDGDGAGVGPGCMAYDCDDSNPDVRVGIREVCNNDVDENCDGSLDDGCPCLDSTGAPLPEGTTEPCEIGACVGLQTCESGLWSSCDAPEPMPETCFDGIDDDCDGVADNGCCPPEQMYCEEAMECTSNATCE